MSVVSAVGSCQRKRVSIALHRCGSNVGRRPVLACPRPVITKLTSNWQLLPNGNSGNETGNWQLADWHFPDESICGPGGCYHGRRKRHWEGNRSAIRERRRQSRGGESHGRELSIDGKARLMR